MLKIAILYYFILLRNHVAVSFQQFHNSDLTNIPSDLTLIMTHMILIHRWTNVVEDVANHV